MRRAHGSLRRERDDSAVGRGERTGIGGRRGVPSAAFASGSGAALSGWADCGRFDRFHLWGDRLFLLNDAAQDQPPAWRLYDLSAAKPTALGAGTLSSRHHRVRGDELPVYEVFADGFLFVREWREGWGGGICCYDLRKTNPEQRKEGK